MSKRYTFVVRGVDTDDDNIDDEVEKAAEAFAEKKGIENFIVTDFFNTTSKGKSIQINIEDVSE